MDQRREIRKKIRKEKNVSFFSLLFNSHFGLFFFLLLLIQQRFLFNYAFLQSTFFYSCLLSRYLFLFIFSSLFDLILCRSSCGLVFFRLALKRLRKNKLLRKRRLFEKLTFFSKKKNNKKTHFEWLFVHQLCFGFILVFFPSHFVNYLIRCIDKIKLGSILFKVNLMFVQLQMIGGDQFFFRFPINFQQFSLFVFFFLKIILIRSNWSN